MKYKLQAFNMWELGKRANQEDSLFPAYGNCNENDRLFIVCDGMGGHDSGEVASATVCEAISNAIMCDGADPEGRFTDSDFIAALNSAYDALDDKDTGAEKKMGTTMTFLKLHSGGATIAHIGDSRVYHIRPGKDEYTTQILFQTRDHSLVNDLIRIGELTPEEAKYSRQKNVITRAMQPNMEYRPKADIYHTTDIKAGDYFMLCSDGVLEELEDENFQYLFSPKGVDDENRLKMLVRMTQEHKDNHTAIIVHILDVEGDADKIAFATDNATGQQDDSEVLEEIVDDNQTTKEETHKVQPEKISVSKVPVVVEDKVLDTIDDESFFVFDIKRNLLKIAKVRLDLKAIVCTLSVVIGLLILYFVISGVVSAKEEKFNINQIWSWFQGSRVDTTKTDGEGVVPGPGNTGGNTSVNNTSVPTIQVVIPVTDAPVSEGAGNTGGNGAATLPVQELIQSGVPHKPATEPTVEEDVPEADSPNAVAVPDADASVVPPVPEGSVPVSEGNVSTVESGVAAVVEEQKNEMFETITEVVNREENQ